MLLVEVPKAARPAFRNLASANPLTRLTGITQTRRWLEELEQTNIERARSSEASWDEIGEALGTSARQARRRRYPLD
jgi:hypothetical protein